MTDKSVLIFVRLFCRLFCRLEAQSKSCTLLEVHHIIEAQGSLLDLPNSLTMLKAFE